MNQRGQLKKKYQWKKKQLFLNILTLKIQIENHLSKLINLSRVHHDRTIFLIYLNLKLIFKKLGQIQRLIITTLVLHVLSRKNITLC